MACRCEPFRLSLSILSLLIFVVNLALNALSGIGTGPFPDSIGNVSRKYNLDITPAGWTFSIWTFIFIWQAIWLIYALVYIIKKDQSQPFAVSSLSFIAFILSQTFQISWLFLWTHEHLIISTVLIFLTCFAAWIFIALQYRNFSINRKAFSKIDTVLIHLFVENGGAIYSTWLTGASILSIGICLKHEGDVTMDAANYTVLSIILVFAVVYAGLEYPLRHFERWTFMTYVVFVITISGSFSSLISKGLQYSPFYYIEIGMLVLFLAFLIGKIISMIFFLMSVLKKSQHYEMTRAT